MEKVKFTRSHDDTIAHIVLDDGQGNVLDNIMMLEILDRLQAIGQDPKIKLITFQGAGAHFSFGASVEEHTKEFAEAMLRTFHKIFMDLLQLRIPTLALVSGQCLGGGMELALICSVILADKSARFGQPEIRLGVFPPPASILLPERIGLARAEELLLTGRSVDADEAQRIGLVHAVYDDKDKLEAAAEDWILKHVVPKSASSLRFASHAARIKLNHLMNNFLPQLERLYVTQLMETRDANEGITAFLEKRKPQWANA